MKHFGDTMLGVMAIALAIPLAIVFVGALYLRALLAVPELIEAYTKNNRNQETSS